MKELLEYREKLVARMLEAAEEFRAACQSYKEPFTKVEGEWTVHQIASHTRDVDKFVYGERIRRTLNEHNPEFEGFDADAWMAEHYDKDEPLENILNDLSASTTDLVNILKTMPIEGWSRVGTHKESGSGKTLQLWVERNLRHVEEHLKTVKKG